MNAKKHIMHVTDIADELLTTIEDESWEEAMQLSQLWDAKIRQLIRSLSAEQFISMQSDIEKIASKNSIIEKHLTKLRAKVLTQIQENNNSRTAIQLYNSSV